MELTKQAMNTIDLSRPYAYVKNLTLSERNTDDVESFSLNDYDFFCIMPYLTLTDSAGKPLESGKNAHNEMRVIFENEVGHNYFDSPITVQALNRVYKNERFAGMYLTDSHRYRVKLNGTNYPSSDINTFPVRSEFHLIGYTIPNKAENKYSVGSVMSRVRVERPYNIEKSFTITSNSATKAETITIGNEEFFVEDIYITLTDGQGRDVLLDDEIQDVFTIKIKTSDDWILFDNVNLRAVNQLWQGKQWKGMVLKQRTDYFVTVSGQTFPTAVNSLNFDAMTASFTIGDTLTGGTSSATATIAGIIKDGTTGTLILTDVSGTFADDETITGGIEGSATANGTTSDGGCLYDLKAQLSFQGYKLKDRG